MENKLKYLTAPQVEDRIARFDEEHRKYAIKYRDTLESKKRAVYALEYQIALAGLRHGSADSRVADTKYKIDTDEDVRNAKEEVVLTEGAHEADKQDLSRCEKELSAIQSLVKFRTNERDETGYIENK